MPGSVPHQSPASVAPSVSGTSSAARWPPRGVANVAEASPEPSTEASTEASTEDWHARTSAGEGLSGMVKILDDRALHAVPLAALTKGSLGTVKILHGREPQVATVKCLHHSALPPQVATVRCHVSEVSSPFLATAARRDGEVSSPFLATAARRAGEVSSRFPGRARGPARPTAAGGGDRGDREGSSPLRGTSVHAPGVVVVAPGHRSRRKHGRGQVEVSCIWSTLERPRRRPPFESGSGSPWTPRVGMDPSHRGLGRPGDGVGQRYSSGPGLTRWLARRLHDIDP